jgi:hypothetical protein
VIPQWRGITPVGSLKRSKINNCDMSDMGDRYCALTENFLSAQVWVKKADYTLLA